MSPARASRPDFADRIFSLIVFTGSALRPLKSIPRRPGWPMVYSGVGHIWRGGSTPETSARPAAARGPGPIGLSTTSVVTSELPATPAPANAAIVDVSTIVTNWDGPSGTP